MAENHSHISRRCIQCGGVHLHWFSKCRGCGATPLVYITPDDDTPRYKESSDGQEQKYAGTGKRKRSTSRRR